MNSLSYLMSNSSKLLSNSSIALLICAFVLGCTPERHSEKSIDELWSDIINEEEDRDLILQWCKELESLALKQPELYADYLIGANAKASSQSLNYEEWTVPLNKGLEDLARYEEHLSFEHIFRTKVFILYENARIHDSKGMVGLAEEKYQKVWESLPQQHPDSSMLVAFQNALPISLAQLALFKGDYKEAESWLSELWEKLDEDHKDYPGVAYGIAAQVEQAKGNESLAIDHYRTAIHYFLKNNPEVKPGHYMELCMNFAEFLRQRGDFDQAMKVISDASKQELQGERHPVYRAYQLAKIHLSQGKFDEAFQEVTQALTLSKAVTNEKYYWHAKILAVQAKIELAQEEWESAARTAQLGLDQLDAADFSENLERIPDPRAIESKLDAVPLLITKARALAGSATGQGSTSLETLDLALVTFSRAIELIQILRAEYKDDEVKEFLSSSSFTLFEPAIETAFALYHRTKKEEYLQQGLKIAETSRSLSLLENLKGQQAQLQLGIPADVLDKENSLKYQISRLEKELRQITDENWKTQNRKLLSARRAAYRTLQQDLQKDYPSYYELKYQEEPMEIETIQSALSRDEAILSFFWGEDNIYGILVTPTQTTFNRISLSDTLITAIKDFKGEISGRRGGTSVAKLKRLISSGYTIYEQLLLSFGALPERVTLVSDGPLHYLPVAALPTKMVTTNSSKDVSYLVEKHIVRRIFSVAVWLRQIRSEKTKAEEEKVSIDTLLVLAPSSFPDDSQLSLDSTALREIFGEKVLLVREVDTERAKALLKRNYKYVLIFSHASAGDGRPYIQLSSDKLYLEEIYHTNMGTRFIVLGACESGVGLDRKGEGVLSLGRAFVYQDVPNAAMTLWEVPDAHSLTITQDLLRKHIHEGLDPAAALRSAQLDFIRNTTASGLPFQWAGFVAIGR